MSDTPETDARVQGFSNKVVSTEFARRLERERDEARKIAETQAMMLAKLDAGTDDLPWEDKDYED